MYQYLQVFGIVAYFFVMGCAVLLISSYAVEIYFRIKNKGSESVTEIQDNINSEHPNK